MTQEEIAKVKSMTREQRLVHFDPSLLSGRIFQEQYDVIMRTPYEVVRVEPPTLLQKNTTEPQQENTREIVQHTRKALSPAQEDQLQALARQFGGTVLPDTPTGEQGELVRKDGKFSEVSQISRNISSG